MYAVENFAWCLLIFLQPVVQDSKDWDTELSGSVLSSEAFRERFKWNTRPFCSTVTVGMKLARWKFYCFMIVCKRVSINEKREKRNEKWRKELQRRFFSSFNPSSERREKKFISLKFDRKLCSRSDGQKIQNFSFLRLPMNLFMLQTIKHSRVPMIITLKVLLIELRFRLTFHMAVPLWWFSWLCSTDFLGFSASF